MFKNRTLYYKTIILLFVIIQTTFAADIFWDGGGGDSLWTNPLNWNDNNVPGLDDDVTINISTFVVILNADGVAKSLTVGLSDTLKIKNGLNLNVDGDVVINGTLLMEGAASMNVEENWTRGGIFDRGNSRIIFDGNEDSYIENSEVFFDLILDKAPGKRLINRGTTNYKITVQNNLDLIAGEFQVRDLPGVDIDVDGRLYINGSNVEGLDLSDIAADGIKAEIGGHFINNSSDQRSFESGNNSELIFNGLANQDISTAVTGYGEVFNRISLRKPAGSLIYMNSNIQIQGDLTIAGGTFKSNGNQLTFGTDAADSIKVYNVLDLDNASGLTVPILRMAAGANLVVHSGGRAKIVGLQSYPTMISSASGAYNFTVLSGGTLEARYYTFEHMNSSGIELFDGSTIDPINNLSDGTFDNIFPGGTGLFVGDITGSNQRLQINNVAFPTNPGSGFNVSKSFSSDTLEFFGASGFFAGEDFDNDPLEPGGNLITWTNVSITRTWTGAINSDWNLAGNWSPVGVPAPDQNVVIPGAPRVPVISTNSPLASCYDLQLRDGGALLVNTTRQLDVNGSLYIGADNDANDGILTLSGTAQVTVGGDFIKQDRSRINANSSTIILNGSGSQTVVSGGVGSEDELNSLTVDKPSGVASLGGAVLLRGNVTISNGSFDAAGYAMTVGGSWNNSGSFTANGNTVTFNSPVAGPVTLSGGGSSFGNVIIDADDRAYVYQLGSLLEAGGDLTINRGTLVAHGYNIELGGDWDNNGTFTPGTTTVVLDGGGPQAVITGGTGAGKSFNNFTVAKSGGMASLSENLLVAGNVTISGGSLDAAGKDITVGGNWSDSGGFIAGNRLVTFSATGGGPYGITSGSSFYNMTINAAGVTYQLGSSLDVNHDLVLTAGTLAAQDNTIRMGRHWTNNASFTAGSGVVIFDGSENQNVNTGGAGAGKGFYDVEIQSTGGVVELRAALDINGSLRVQSGTFDMNGRATTVFANFENSGVVTAAGQLTFDGTGGGPYSITGGGSALEGVVVNAPGVSYRLGGETRVDGNLTVSAGTLDVNGRRLVFGDNGADVLSVSGTFEVDAGGELAMFNDSEVLVNSGGEMRVVGVSGTRATVTGQSGSGSYDFTVSSGATIHARYGLFEYMGVNGINVTDGATIDALNNFSDVNFDHGPVGGTMLRVGDISGSNQRVVINLAGFITNPGGTSYNVTKTLSSDTLEFFQASGFFAGEDFDNDPLEPGGNLITWTNVSITRTWTGAINSDWNLAGNWSPVGVPAPDQNVVIPGAPRVPVISTNSPLASCYDLQLRDGGALLVNTTRQLDVNGSLYIGADNDANDGILTLSGTAQVTVGGDFIKQDRSRINANSSTIILNGSGSQTVVSGGVGSEDELNSLTVDKPSGVASLGGAVLLRGNVTISNGSFDAAGYAMTVGGSWNNSGSFTANGNTVTFNSPVAGPVTLSGGGSSFGNVIIDADDRAYVYQLGSLLEAGGDLTINRGTLVAHGYNIELGGDWDNNGTFTPGTTTVVLDGGGPQAVITGGTGAGKSFNNFTVAKSGGMASLSENLLVAGNVTISGGSLDAAGKDITVGGNWSDSGGFIAGNRLVTFSATGGGPYGITSGSSFYNMTINAAGVTYQLGSSLDVNHDLVLTAGTLAAQDNTIRMGRHWTNNASFTAGSGVVIFDGSENQNVNTGGAGAGKGFYDVEIQSTGGVVELRAALDINGSLRVQSGTFDMNGRATTVFANFENSGVVTAAGQLTFDGTGGGPYSITGGGSALEGVVVNAPGVSYRLGGETRVDGNLTVSAGTLDVNGRRLVFGDNGADVLSVSGTFEVDAGGELAMFNDSEVLVNSGGEMRVVGVSGTRATVTGQSGSGSYDFTVSSGATIHARYGLFEYMGVNGINVTDGATIDALNNFSDVNFDHGPVGGTMLRVGDISGSNQRVVINLAGFITNPGGTSYNVTKTLSSDTLEFENSFGDFAGETFDNDALEPTGNLIRWVAVAALRTWTGQQNTNWHNAQNWNPLGVPAASEDVVINNVTNDPIISVDHVSVRNITLNTGASLTIQNGFDLDINGQYVNSNANLIITSSNTSINISGNWYNIGSYSNGQGTVVFDGSNLQEIACGGAGGNTFCNVIITNPDTVRLLAIINVERQLAVSNGVLDINGQTMQFGSLAGDQITVSGTMRINDNSSLQMFAGTQILVNDGGVFSVVGSGQSTRPIITNQGTGNYHITIVSGGTLECQYAIFEYTSNGGIHIPNGANIDPSAKLDNTIFRHGAGNAYLTISNAQNFVINGVQFDSAATGRNSYNVVYNGTGSLMFSDYTGTLSGARYENDSGSGTRGNVGWYFTQNEIVNNESQTFGNDVVLTTAANLGSVSVSLIDQVLSIAPASVARFYTIVPTNGGSCNLRLVYGDGELQTQVESALKIWLRREGSWTNLAGTVNTALNYIELTAGEYQLISGVTDTLVISDAEDDTSLPVELVAFAVSVVNNQVTLEWQTASEIDNAYWLIDRKLISKEEFNDLQQGILGIEETSNLYTNIASLAGQGTTNSQTDYQYVDGSADLGTCYAYRLADVSVHGQVNYHPAVLLKSAVVPNDFELSQNYPNPFNPETMITYSVPVRSRVILKIYNILGQEIRTLIDGETDPGFYEIRWDGTNQNRQVVGSGTYIYQISVRSQDGKQSFNQSRKMTLMR